MADASSSWKLSPFGAFLNSTVYSIPTCTYERDGATVTSTLCVDPFVSPLLVILREVEKIGHYTTINPHIGPLNDLDAFVCDKAGVLGINSVVLKFSVCLILSNVFGMFNRFFPTGLSRHLYSIVVGYLMLQFIFHEQWIHLLICAVLVYLFNHLTLLLNFPMPTLNGCLVFAYLTLMHYRRLEGAEIDAGSIDCLVFQMVLTIKLYVYGYNLFDGTGREGEKNKAAAAEYKALVAEGKFRDCESAVKLEDVPEDASRDTRKAIEKKNASLLKREKERRDVLKARYERSLRSLSGTPSFITFLGFLLNPTTIFVGPAFEIVKYTRTQEREDRPQDATRWIPAAYKLAQGLGWMVANLIGTKYFPIEGPYLNAMAGTYSIPVQVAITTATLVVVRTSYYFCWKTAESACIFAGYGHILDEEDPEKAAENAKNALAASRATHLISLENDKVVEDVYPALMVWQRVWPMSEIFGTSDWDGTSNVDVLKVELSSSMKETVNLWNKYTQQWLERYYYLRTPRWCNHLVVFAVSSFWHGLFPGYYLGFFSALLIMSNVKNITPFAKPLFKGSILGELLSEALGLTFRISFSGFALIAFNIYKWDKIITIWDSWYYYGFIIAIGAGVITTILSVLKVGGGGKKEKKGAKIAAIERASNGGAAAPSTSKRSAGKRASTPEKTPITSSKTKKNAATN